MIEFELPLSLPEPPAAPPPPDIDIPPEAFGARQIAGLMPEALDDLLYRQETATANATRVEELNNDFVGRQREILQTGPDAFYNRQGRDAILAAPDVIGRLQAVQDDLLGEAATPSQKAMLSKALHHHMAVTHYGIGDHVGRQSREWQKGVAQARLDHLHEQARHHYDDHDLIAGYAGAGESVAADQARLVGLKLDSEAAKAQAAAAHSAIWRRAIEAALAADNHRAASTLHERASGRLTPADTAVLQPQLKAAAEIETARDYLAKIVPPVSKPPTFFDVARLMEEAEAAHAAATERNNADWADNPTQRATNQHYIDVQFGQRKRSIEQAKVQLDEAVTDWLMQSKQDGQLQTTRPPLAIWTQLSPDRQQMADIILAQHARGTDTTQRPEPAPARGTAPLPEPPPGSPEHETATKELLPEVDGPLSGLGRWIFRSGKPVRYPFDKIDTTSVIPEQFWEVQEILRRGRPGTYKIDGRKSFWVGKNFDSRFVVGNIRLRIEGDLVIGNRGNYSFKGKLSALPDQYRMYESNHRNDVDEGTTRLGKALGSLGHSDYKIHITGEKPIASSGNYTP